MNRQDRIILEAVQNSPRVVAGLKKQLKNSAALFIPPVIDIILICVPLTVKQSTCVTTRVMT